MPKSRDWTHILVHHSAGKDQPRSDTVEFRRQHRAKGWADIGYHAVVERIDGKIVVMPGRPVYMQGAHCPGMNQVALGICLAGNFSEAPPDIDLLRAAADYVADWMVKYGIPIQNVQGHRDHRATQCPGNFFDMAEFRRLILSLGTED